MQWRPLAKPDRLPDDVPEDEVGHGTHVSGIVAAKGLQMDEGVYPECTIMPVRVLAALRTGERLSGAGIVDNINAVVDFNQEPRHVQVFIYRRDSESNLALCGRRQCIGWSYAEQNEGDVQVDLNRNAYS